MVEMNSETLFMRIIGLILFFIGIINMLFVILTDNSSIGFSALLFGLSGLFFIIIIIKSLLDELVRVGE
jgi:hypothetical protein